MDLTGHDRLKLKLFRVMQMDYLSNHPFRATHYDVRIEETKERKICVIVFLLLNHTSDS